MLASFSNLLPPFAIRRGKQTLVAAICIAFVLAISCIEVLPRWAPAKNLWTNETVSDQSRIEMRVAKVGEYRGRSPGLSRVSYALVSGVGVMGMFAAIVGSMLGVWLDETTDESEDSDGYCFWDDGEWDIGGDVGWEREQHYAGMRELGSLLHR